MTKRKPDGKNVIVYRLEFQDKERELIEQAIVGHQFTTIIDSIVKGISSMDIMTMYGILTLLEGLGIIDTPIPTITDLMNNPEDSAKAAAAGAISDWANNRRRTREESTNDGNLNPIDKALYEAYDTFWVTRLIGMILDPTGTGNQNN